MAEEGHRATKALQRAGVKASRPDCAPFCQEAFIAAALDPGPPAFALELQPTPPIDLGGEF